MEPRYGERGRPNVAATIACAAAVLCATFLGLGIGGLNDIAKDQARNSTLLERALETATRATRTYENIWVSGGETFRVSVSSRDGETTAQLILRFEEELRLAKKEHPPERR